MCGGICHPLGNNNRYVVRLPCGAEPLINFILFCFEQFTKFGDQGSTILLKTCLHHLTSQGEDVKIMQVKPVIRSVLKHLSGQPNFTTVFCLSLESTDITEGFLESLCNVLDLSLPEKIAISLALLDSKDHKTKMDGRFLFNW